MNGRSDIRFRDVGAAEAAELDRFFASLKRLSSFKLPLGRSRVVAADGNTRFGDSGVLSGFIRGCRSLKRRLRASGTSILDSRTRKRTGIRSRNVDGRRVNGSVKGRMMTVDRGLGSRQAGRSGNDV